MHIGNSDSTLKASKRSIVKELNKSRVGVETISNTKNFFQDIISSKAKGNLASQIIISNVSLVYFRRYSLENPVESDHDFHDFHDKILIRYIWIEIISDLLDRIHCFNSILLFLLLKSQSKGNKDKDFWRKLEYALEHGMIFQNVCMRLPVSFIFAGNPIR